MIPTETVPVFCQELEEKAWRIKFFFSAWSLTVANERRKIHTLEYFALNISRYTLIHFYSPQISMALSAPFVFVLFLATFVLLKCSCLIKHCWICEIVSFSTANFVVLRTQVVHGYCSLLLEEEIILRWKNSLFSLSIRVCLEFLDVSFYPLYLFSLLRWNCA